MVRELEFELTEFTVSHIRFDSYANDVPAGGLYEISHDAYAYRGYHHRGETGFCSLVTHWRYGTFELTALPGSHVEDRARPLDLCAFYLNSSPRPMAPKQARERNLTSHTDTNYIAQRQRYTDRRRRPQRQLSCARPARHRRHVCMQLHMAWRKHRSRAVD